MSVSGDHKQSERKGSKMKTEGHLKKQRQEQTNESNHERSQEQVQGVHGRG